MEIINKYDQYIKGTSTEEGLEVFTREIVEAHFEKEKIQNRWAQILKEEHKLSGTMVLSEKTPSLKNLKRFVKTGFAIAASVLVITLCWFTFQKSSVPTYEALLSQEFNNPYVETISRKGPVEELSLQATSFYNEREYASAANYFEQLNNIDNSVDWDFYIALCQLYQRQSDLAINSFNALLQHPDKKYNIETNWYLGLAYTLHKDFDAAKKHLSFVVEQSNDEMAWKVKEAKELLKALEEKE